MYRSAFIALLALVFAAAPVRAAESGAIPSNVEVTIPTQAPPQQQDRSQNSGAATAMAIVGAAMAGASCMMLMSQAKQEPDPSQKRMLMAMAMQQCAQAAQSAANAAQNKDGQKKTQDEGPKGSQLKTDFANAETPKKSDEKTSLPTSPTTETTPEAIAEATAAPATETAPGVVEPSAFNNTTAAVAAPEPTQNIGVAAESWSMLKPVDPKTVRFDDNAKPTDQSTLGGDTSPNLGASAGSLAAAGAGAGSAAAALAKLTGPFSMDAKAAARKEKGKDVHGEGEGGGGTSGEGKEAPAGGSGGNAEFDSIMASILGGPPGANAAGTPVATGDVLLFGSGEAGDGEGKLPNIFQYASYRFRKTAFEEHMIRLRKSKTDPDRLLAAETISVGKKALAAVTPEKPRGKPSTR